MRIKRKAVSSSVATDMPMDVVHPPVSVGLFIGATSPMISAGDFPVYTAATSDFVGLMHPTTSSIAVANGNLELPHSNVAVPSLLQTALPGLHSPLQVSHGSVSNSVCTTVFHNPHHVMPGTFAPVQVTTVDGSVSTFIPSHNVTHSFTSTQQATFSQGPSGTRNDSPFHSGPVILNFSQADASPDDESMLRSHNFHSQTSQATTSTGRISRARGVRGPGVRQRPYTGRPNSSNADALPMQGPLAPPQREGAPSEYVSFGSCDQVCQYCSALFWSEEKKAGTPLSAPPQFGKCCVGGRAVLRMHTHYPVYITDLYSDRDKLLEADIPNFQIRLFGVVGANQYELPTADTIGAIVYEESTPEVTALATSRRSLAYFTELNTADNSKFIEARVYRKWTAMKVPSLVPTGFSCILLDKKGSAIQANADLKEKERFEHDLQINGVYRIQGFGFEKADNWGKTLDNDITLCFGKHTQIDSLSDNNYPHHYFNFAAYNELGLRLEKRNPILTDYIGYIHNVEKVKEYGGATGNKIKLRNIGIRNLNNNVVIFTLWNQKADAFEEEEYSKMQQPVVLAVSSCYLKAYGGQLQLSATSATCYYFNPPLDETSELLAAYSHTNQ
ncbi:nucleic acid-binding, OB-fold protein [Artemisia annua]|uniref:Nucleic acid-binding, OB-fold protein n=1 Tax=Artemisia annua TaxID=35608 RepID=A0A2U1PU08_ARTAN|nr:nucleic acid-binding, OB-fold protein [Artemisia annua]